MIIIRPYGSLCNRIAVINASYKLADKTGHTLIILWDVDSYVGCCYQALLKKKTKTLIFNIYSNYLETNNLIKKRDLINIYINRYIEKYIYNWIDKKAVIKKIIIGKINPENITKISISSIKKLSNLKLIYIASYAASPIYSTHDYSDIKLTDIANNKIDYLINLCGGKRKYIGIHIRRAVDPRFTLESPTSLFIQRMKEILQEEKNIKFYLATDEKNMEQYLKNIFGKNRIISNPYKNLEVNSLNGLIDAIIDLKCLSMSKLVIGTYASWYSYLGARLGDTKLQIIKSKSITSHYIDFPPKTGDYQYYNPCNIKL